MAPPRRESAMRLVRAITILLSIAALAITAPDLALAADVYDTTATLQWAAATGPVASYAVFIARNGQGYPTAPDQIVTETQATLQAAFGDTVVVRIAARDALGSQGPYSEPSDPIHFIEPVPVMQLTKTSLSATAPQGTSPSDGLFSITNAGQSRLDYAIASSESWVSTLPASGSAAANETDDITVRYQTDALPEGVHTATLTVSATGLPGQQISTSVTIEPAPAVLAVNKSSLVVVVTGGFDPPSQSFQIRNVGGGTLSYTITDANDDVIDWISASPASGTIDTGTDVVTLTFGTSGLAPGSFQGTVTVTATGGQATQTRQISVGLTVTQPLGTPGQPILVP
jgi:hypothetical protein